MKIGTLFLGLFVILAFSFSVKAQVPYWPELQKEIPRLNLKNKSLNFLKEKPTFGTTAQQSAANTNLVNYLSAELVRQFKTYQVSQDTAVPTCDSESLFPYLRSLLVMGQLKNCSDIALQCADSEAVKTPQVYFVGAQCEMTQFHYAKADQLMALASADRFKNHVDYSEVVLQMASAQISGIHEDQIDSVLAKNPQWSPADLKLWKSILFRVARSDLGGVSKQEVDSFLASQIQIAQGGFKKLLQALQIRIFASDSQYDQALQLLKDHAAELENPLLWYDLAYSSAYYGFDDTEFVKSRKIYETLDPYMNRWSSLPVENNTYNYTEIYKNVCPQVLLAQGLAESPPNNQFETAPQSAPEYYELKTKIRTGAISLEEALAQAQQLNLKYPQKADLLTTLGGLQSLLGWHEEAVQSYWQAHRLCRYYHRANWGLALEKRYSRYEGRPDYVSNAAKVDRELQGRVIPDVISKYIINWKALSIDVQKRVEYGARIWFPAMAPLKENENSAYIKFAFDLLSESPGMSDIRDRRIGGANYPHDHRLWDDVRGVGGNTVVADLEEVFQTVQGDYNLLGHEMTHQYQSMFESAQPLMLDCLEHLYSQAQKSNNFADAYSSYNKEEYFAQGVTYYLVPEDSPANFGLNGSWIRKHDADLYSWIQNIEKSAGNLNKIECSIK